MDAAPSTRFTHDGSAVIAAVPPGRRFGDHRRITPLVRVASTDWNAKFTTGMLSSYCVSSGTVLEPWFLSLLSCFTTAIHAFLAPPSHQRHRDDQARTLM